MPIPVSVGLAACDVVVEVEEDDCVEVEVGLVDALSGADVPDVLGEALS